MGYSVPQQGYGGSFRYIGSGRYYMYNNNRWVSKTAAYGASGNNAYENLGVGATPALTLECTEFPVIAGDKIDTFHLTASVSHLEVTAIDIALMHKDTVNGAGTLLGSWLALPVIKSKVGGALLEAGMSSALIVPSNGSLLVAIRPVGVLTTTRYTYESHLIVGTPA